MKRTCISLLIIGVLLAGCSLLEPAGEVVEQILRQSSTQSSQPEQPVVEPDGFLYGRSFLSPDAREIYDRLCNAAQALDLETRIPIPQSISNDETQQLVRHFWDDNPRYYWAVPVLITTQPVGNRYLQLEVHTDYTLELVQEQLEQIDLAVQLLESQELPPFSSGTEYDYALRLHDLLGRRIEYDAGGSLRDKTTLYGALVDGVAVCDGYTKAYQYLLDRVGIPCIYLVGKDIEDVPHSWNALQLEGQWYYADITWDDQEMIRHDYFLVTLDEISREHYWDNSQYLSLPHSNSSGESDYYRREGLMVDPLDEELLEQFARAFVRQLPPDAEAGDGPFLLEVKVEGEESAYWEAKDFFVEQAFEILDYMQTLLAGEESAGYALDYQDGVTWSCSDTLYILTLFIDVR